MPVAERLAYGGNNNPMWEAMAIGAAAGGVWYSSRFAWWRPSVAMRYPRILMYHMIQPPRPGSSYNGLRVPPMMFEAQLEWLASEGWNFRFASDLAEGWSAAAEKTVAITFDDGYRDNLTHALPLLEKYNARATLYLVADRFSDRDWSSQKKAHHNSGELRDAAKLTDEDVDTLLASGRFELGGHTVTHLNMATADRATKQRELTESRSQLEDRFQTRVRSFAYPFGLYADGDPDLVREMGYTSAVTTHSGIDTQLDPDRFQLRRIKVSGRESMREFRLRVRTGWRAWNK